MSTAGPTSTLAMKTLVAVFGGFEGTEANPGQRVNIRTAPTILSGDIDNLGTGSLSP